MTDLHFTHEGTEAEMLSDVATIKEMLADAGLLRRFTDEEGQTFIGNPRNVLGPRQGFAATQVDDGEGGTIRLPAKGRADRWYLVLRTDFTIEALSQTLGIGLDRIVDGQLVVAGKATLHLEPDEALAAEFRRVLGVWA